MSSVRQGCLGLAGLAATIGPIAMGYPIAFVLPLVVLGVGLAAGVGGSGEPLAPGGDVTNEPAGRFVAGFVLWDAVAVWVWSRHRVPGVGLFLLATAVVIVVRWWTEHTAAGRRALGAMQPSAERHGPRSRWRVRWDRACGVLFILFGPGLAIHAAIHLARTEWLLGVRDVVAFGFGIAFVVAISRAEVREHRSRLSPPQPRSS